MARWPLAYVLCRTYGWEVDRVAHWLYRLRPISDWLGMGVVWAWRIRGLGARLYLCWKAI